MAFARAANLSAGLLITGNTRYLPVVTFAGAAVTALFCWWLIPLSGMDGAAYAIVAGTAVMCLVMTWYSLKVFPLRYDWLKLFLLLVAGIALALLQFNTAQLFQHPFTITVSKVGLLAIYFTIAVALFRQEVQLVAVKVSNKFRVK